MPISLLKNIYWPTKLIVLKTVKTAIKKYKIRLSKNKRYCNTMNVKKHYRPGGAFNYFSFKQLKDKQQRLSFIILLYFKNDSTLFF
ncbi:hypothetical protein YA31_19165 [Klebsiella aerogenes]|nr:hypothetical protein YA31_19165 [Klebsiella aerogenes]